MENKKYSEEFKQSIVSLYNSGKSSSEICREYGMSTSTLHKWIKQNTQVRVSDTETLTAADVKRLQKKLALLEEENLIQKKPWLSSQRNKGTGWRYSPTLQGSQCATSVSGAEGSQKHLLRQLQCPAVTQSVGKPRDKDQDFSYLSTE